MFVRINITKNVNYIVKITFIRQQRCQLFDGPLVKFSQYNNISQIVTPNSNTTKKSYCGDKPRTQDPVDFTIIDDIWDYEIILR